MIGPCLVWQCLELYVPCVAHSNVTGASFLPRPGCSTHTRACWGKGWSRSPGQLLWAVPQPESCRPAVWSHFLWTIPSHPCFSNHTLTRKDPFSVFIVLAHQLRHTLQGKGTAGMKQTNTHPCTLHPLQPTQCLEGVGMCRWWLFCILGE